VIFKRCSLISSTCSLRLRTILSMRSSVSPNNSQLYFFSFSVFSFNVLTISASLSSTITSSSNLKIDSSKSSMLSVYFLSAVFLSDKSVVLNSFSLTQIVCSSPINSIPPLQNQTSLQHFLPHQRDLQQIYDNFQYSH